MISSSFDQNISPVRPDRPGLLRSIDSLASRRLNTIADRHTDCLRMHLNSVMCSLLARSLVLAPLRRRLARIVLVLVAAARRRRQLHFLRRRKDSASLRLGCSTWRSCCSSGTKMRSWPLGTSRASSNRAKSDSCQPCQSPSCLCGTLPSCLHRQSSKARASFFFPLGHLLHRHRCPNQGPSRQVRHIFSSVPDFAVGLS